MSHSDKTNRRGGGSQLFDPEVFACWRMLTDVAPRLTSVRRITARGNPVDPKLDGHVHAVPTLVCCLQGATRVETVGGPYDLPAGGAVVIAPGAWHRHAELRDHSVVYAQGLMARRSDVVLLAPPRRWWLTIPEQPSANLLQRALAVTDDSQRLNVVRELLTVVAHEPAAAVAMSPNQQAMAHYLWLQFTRGITAADILRISGLSRAQAYRAFAASFGESPKRALTRTRLGLAAHLDAEGYAPQQVASRSGFVTAARWRRSQRLWRE